MTKLEAITGQSGGFYLRNKINEVGCFPDLDSFEVFKMFVIRPYTVILNSKGKSDKWYVKRVNMTDKFISFCQIRFYFGDFPFVGIYLFKGVFRQQEFKGREQKYISGNGILE